jgi:predicted dehydrogenase
MTDNATDKIRFAIVGCGQISQLHARAYAGSDAAEIFAVCDTNKDRATRRQREWGAKKAYTEFEDVITDSEVQAVELLVPHMLHKEMTVAALRAKKHVSVQKPMAVSIPEAEEMVRVAREEGTLLKVFENFVFYPPYVKAKALVAEGAIGELITVRMRLTTSARGGWDVNDSAVLWHIDKAKSGGGILVFDDGYHKYSQAYDIGGKVHKVFAWIDSWEGLVDSPAFVMWKYQEGERARYGAYDITFAPNLYIESDYYAGDDRMELVGTEGIIYVNRCTAKMLQEPPLVLYREGETRAFHSLRDDWADSFIDSGRHFFECIKNGGDPILSGETGLAVQRFAMAPEISHREHREVDPATLSA